MVQDSRLKINTSSTTKTAGGNVNGSNSGDSKYATESPTLMPIASEADIDYSLIYALHTFVANLEGQVCVLKGDSLELLDDSNSYWWLVKCIKTQEIGYIPAENVETPTERLARLNGQRNIDHASAKDVDKQSKAPSMHKKPQRIQFSAAAPEIFEEYGSDDGNDARNGENNPYYEYEYNPEDEIVSASTGSLDTISSGRSYMGNDGNRSLGRSQDSSQGSSKTKLWEKLFRKKEPERSPSLNSGSNSPISYRSYSNLDDSASAAPSPRPPSSFNGGTPGKPRFNEREIMVSPRGSSVNRNPAFESGSNSGSMNSSQRPNAINVLRIFAGNVNLDATFKSVAFTETMIASELVNGALKKFRVQGANPADYYISVLYMDSQRQLNDNEVVFKVLDALKQKNLPGIGDFSKVSQSYGFRGNVSTVRITDDSLIRVLINKKSQELIDGPLRPMRIAYHDLPSQKRIYRTIGIPRGAKAEDAIEIALLSFGMQPSAEVEYSLCSVLNNQETVLIPGEPLIPIMRVAEQRGQDLSFLLLRDKLVLPDIPSANNSKPSFAKQGANNVETPSAPRKYSETGSVDTGYAQPTKFVIANPDELQKNSATTVLGPPIASSSPTMLSSTFAQSNVTDEPPSERIHNKLDWINASLDRRTAMATNEQNSPKRKQKDSPSSFGLQNTNALASTHPSRSGNSSPFSKSSTTSRNEQTAASSAGSSYFGSMVDYLDETLKENSDERRIQQMEKDLEIDTSQHKLSTVDRLKRRSSLFKQAPILSSKNESRTGSTSTSLANRGLDGSRITENTNPSSESLSTPLKNVLNNIEADIEAILRKNVKQDSERRKSVRLSTNLIAQKVSRTSAAQQANARSSPKPDSVSTIIAANIDSDKDDIDALYLAFNDTQQQLGGLEKMIEDLIGKAISLIDIPSPSGQLSVISPAPLSATRQMVYSNIHVK